MLSPAFGWTTESRLQIVLLQDQRSLPGSALNIAAIVFHPNLGQVYKRQEC